MTEKIRKNLICSYLPGFSGLTFSGTRRPGFSGRICCFWPGFSGRSFSGIGNLKNSMGSRQIVLVSTAGFSVLTTGIFWREAKTKRLFHSVLEALSFYYSERFIMTSNDWLASYGPKS